MPLVAGDDPAIAVDVGGEGDRGVCEREAGVLMRAAHRLREVGELRVGRDRVLARLHLAVVRHGDCKHARRRDDRERRADE